MTKETLNFLHRTYISIAEAQKTSNIIDILKELHQKLSDFIPKDEDVEEFDIFLRNLESSIKIRTKTFQITNFVSDIVFAMLYIAIWANREKHLDIDINLIARRKSLESELTKMLEKSDIHDRFGIRGIVLNQDSDDDHIEINKLMFFSNYVHNILTKCNRKEYNQFAEWVRNNPRIDNFTKARLSYVLQIPFRVYNVKDYIANPKKNGYQSLHFVLMTEMYSDYMPGAEFEIQLRTNRMHQQSVNGESNHDLYKNSIDEDLKQVFKIEDFSKVNIIGFTSYNSLDDDIDGIHWAKTFANRRISTSLVIN